MQKLLDNQNWVKTAWEFIDSNNLMNEHAKNHATSNQVKNIALKTNSLIYIRLENLIDNRVQLSKKKH